MDTVNLKKLPDKIMNEELIDSDIIKNNKKGNSDGPTTLGGLVVEILKFFVLALVIVAPIRMFIAQPFIVSGDSMEPTFSSNQYLIVDELSYRLGKPERGDVVILRPPLDSSKFYIKRIVGLPNETVEITDGIVKITADYNQLGFILNEDYVTYTKGDSLNVKLGSDEYFVMGDNRAASSDSRAWGPVEEKSIIGKAFIRLLPIASAAILPGESR